MVDTPTSQVDASAHISGTIPATTTTQHDEYTDNNTRSYITRSESHTIHISHTIEGLEETAELLYELATNPRECLERYLDNTLPDTDAEYRLQREDSDITITLSGDSYRTVYLAARKRAYQATSQSMVRQGSTPDSVLLAWFKDGDANLVDRGTEYNVHIKSLERAASGALKAFCFTNNSVGGIAVDALPPESDIEFSKSEILDDATYLPDDK